MTRSLSLLSALALGSTALVIAHSPKSDAMTIAYDCFDRTTSQLVARSAVDMTSPAVSCLAVPGGQSATPEQNQPDNSDDVFQVDDDGSWDASTPEDGDFNDNDSSFPDNGDMAEDSQSTGDQLGAALGNHLGKLLGQGLNDLFGRR